MQIKQYVKMAFQNILLPAVYRIWARKPVIPGLVVFADAHHDSRPENLELLVAACRQEPGWEVRELYLDYQKNAPGRVLGAMLSFMKLYARAQYVVICDNFLPAASCQKREQTRVIQLWHACGSLKRFGYDTQDDIPAGYRGNVFRGTDLVTVSAPYCEAKFASAMRLPAGHVKALGVSRTDRYFSAAWRARAMEKVKAAFPEARGKKIALWAPTFRGQPGHPRLPELDTAELERRLGGDWKVISSVHPHMRAGTVAVTTEELFVSADCLIADYSSLLFEYLLTARLMGTRKRLALYIPDYDDYAGRRGFYMDYGEIPGVRARSLEELAGVILSGAERDEGTMERDAFLDRYMSACDGGATGRILEEMKRLL